MPDLKEWLRTERALTVRFFSDNSQIHRVCGSTEAIGPMTPDLCSASAEAQASVETEPSRTMVRLRKCS